MGFQKRGPGPSPTGLWVGLLLLLGPGSRARPTSLSGTAGPGRFAGCWGRRGGEGSLLFWRGQAPPAGLQPPCLSPQLWPTTRTCAGPARTPTAASTAVSSALGSPTPRRRPTAATCGLPGAPAARGRNSRPCTESTCPPFRPRPSSGADPNAEPATRGSRIRGSVPRFRGGVRGEFAV